MIWLSVCQVYVPSVVYSLPRIKVGRDGCGLRMGQDCGTGKPPVPILRGTGGFDAWGPAVLLFPDLQSNIKGTPSPIDQEENGIPSLVGAYLFVEFPKGFYSRLVHLKNDVPRGYASFRCG